MLSVSSDQNRSGWLPSDKLAASTTPFSPDRGSVRVVLRLPELKAGAGAGHGSNTAPAPLRAPTEKVAAHVGIAQACRRMVFQRNAVWSCIVAMLIEFALAGLYMPSKPRKPPPTAAPPHAAEPAVQQPRTAAPATVVAPPAATVSDGANHDEWLSGSANAGPRAIDDAGGLDRGTDNPPLWQAKTGGDEPPAESPGDAPESVRLAERPRMGADRVSGADTEIVRLKAIEPIEDMDSDSSAGGSDR